LEPATPIQSRRTYIMVKKLSLALYMWLNSRVNLCVVDRRTVTVMSPEFRTTCKHVHTRPNAIQNTEVLQSHKHSIGIAPTKRNK
jgi:hypothetical protein